MNKLKLDETISEILYIKHLKVIIDRLYREKNLLTKKEHEIIIKECDKRILKCESDWIKKKEAFDEIEFKVKQGNKKASRKNSKREKPNNKSSN